MRNEVSTSANASGGIGLFGLTFVVLLVLKLTSLADLSWWWVFAPLLIGAGLWVFIIGVVTIFAIAMNGR